MESIVNSTFKQNLDKIVAEFLSALNQIYFLMFVCCFFFRGKYHKLKYGTEMNPEDLKPPSFEKDVKGKILQILQVIYC